MPGEGIRSNLVQYVQGGPEKVQGLLFEPEEAVQAAERAINSIRLIYPDTQPFQDVDDLNQQIIFIATYYHNDYSWFKRDSGADFRQQVIDIQKAIKRISDIIKEPKNSHTHMVFLRALDKAIEKNSLTAASRAPSPDAQRFLKALLNMNIEVPSRAKRGKPANDHIKAAARHLIRTYEAWTGEKYRKTLDIARGQGKEHEFLSPGPSFVWLALRAIDPQLTFSEVRSALKELPLRTSPENIK